MGSFCIFWIWWHDCDVVNKVSDIPGILGETKRQLSRDIFILVER